jgi:hypothetical protein
VVVPAALTAGRTRVGDSRRRPVPAQRLHDGSLAVWVADVPALGSARLSLQAGGNGVGRGFVPTSRETTPDPVSPASAQNPAKASPTTLDNGRIRVELDPATGAIRSLRSVLAPGVEFVGAGPGLNVYLYVPGRDPAQARTTGSPRITIEEAGPLVAVLRIESDAPGAKGLVRRVRLLAGSDRVELEDVLDKTPVREKESAHVAFPFAVPGGVIRADEGAAIVIVEKDQLPGSCKDFIGANSAVDVSNAEVGISLATIDAPLIEIGALTDERQPGGQTRPWRETAAPGTTVYAYLLNNYWHTNYKADQSGMLTFRFALQPHGAFDPAALRRFGAGQEQPLLVHPADPATPVRSAPFRVAGNGAVVVSSIRPAGEGTALLVRLYNASASPAQAEIAPAGARGSTRVARADEDGRAIESVRGPLTLPAYGSVLLRIDWNY